MQQWKLLFKAVIALWKARPAMPAEAFADKLAQVEADVERLLNQPIVQPGDVAIQNRLLTKRPHLLAPHYTSRPPSRPTTGRAFDAPDRDHSLALLRQPHRH